MRYRSGTRNVSGEVFGVLWKAKSHREEDRGSVFEFHGDRDKGPVGLFQLGFLRGTFEAPQAARLRAQSLLALQLLRWAERRLSILPATMRFWKRECLKPTFMRSREPFGKILGSASVTVVAMGISSLGKGWWEETCKNLRVVEG
jgi:hypothetical protein